MAKYVDEIEALGQELKISYSYQSPLLKALMDNEDKNNTQAKSLILNGCDINARSGAQYAFKTPLEYAVNSKRIDMVTMLLDNGADINAPALPFNQSILQSAKELHGNNKYIDRISEIFSSLDKKRKLSAKGTVFVLTKKDGSAYIYPPENKTFANRKNDRPIFYGLNRFNERIPNNELIKGDIILHNIKTKGLDINSLSLHVIICSDWKSSAEKKNQPERIIFTPDYESEDEFNSAINEILMNPGKHSMPVVKFKTPSDGVDFISNRYNEDQSPSM